MTSSRKNNTDDNEKDRLAELQAVDKAKASADAAFKATPRVWNNMTDAAALLRQVDGPALSETDGKESVYVGHSLPVPAGDSLQVPISVTVPNSMVSYEVELVMGHDIGFGIAAQREEEEVTVKEDERMSTDEAPLVRQKFLVGTVPCLIQFRWDNTYSWMREKMVSYKITVQPPSKESVMAGRRRRAKACLLAVSDDSKHCTAALDEAASSRKKVQARVQKLQDELAAQEKKLEQLTTQEEELTIRKDVRAKQEKMLAVRLKRGWSDEKEN